jgi:hypothetical protein
MQLCSSDVVINFLLIAKMQQHDSARETDLHFAASPNALGRVQYVLKLSLFSSVSILYQGAPKEASGITTRASYHNRLIW